MTVWLSNARALSAHPMSVLPLLALLGVLSAVISLTWGALSVPVMDVVGVIMGHVTGLDLASNPTFDAVVWQIRVPRTVLAWTVGASLATSGALFQGLFRNPLADPGLLGITMGSAAAVSIAVLFGATLGAWFGPLRPFLLPVAAALGGGFTLLAVVALARSQGALDTSTLLLGGIAMSAIAGAITGLVIYLADDAQLRDLTFWTLGGLGGSTWTLVAATVPILCGALAFAPWLGRQLDCLALGETEAHHLGVPVARTKRLVIVIGAVLVGGSVSAAGAIGFVGLVVPHLVRLVLGPGHRVLLPASALLGGAGLVLADVLARTIVAPGELPIGVLTTLLGGPFFVALLIRGRTT